MRIFSLIALSLTAVTGISFAVLNAQIVPVHFYLGNREMPLSLLVVFSLILGIIIGIATILPTVWRLKFELRHLRRRSGY